MASFELETLHETFDAQASARPRATAGIHAGNRITYGELRSRSDELAVRLTDAGVCGGDKVGLCGTRSLDALVAILGILKTGAAYVPLDDTSPPARLRAMAEDAGVQVAVTLPGSVCRIRRLRTQIDLGASPSSRAGAAALPAVAATDCAYVMFTSGSTGRPKPVAIPHRGVVRLALSDIVFQRPRPGERVLHGYNLSSDASTIEIWASLVGGACLVIVDREELLSPAALESRLLAERVTIAYLTTCVFHHVARTRPEAFRTLRFVSAGGEAMDPDLARAVLAACPDTTLVNFYGPTENSVVSTAQLVLDVPADAMSIPIGRPLEHTTCHLLRPDGTAADVDEEGELLVGGAGLALGYLGDPGLTAERFVDDPGRPGSRLYRTGDLATRSGDGALEYLGRADRQVKLRGHRIELEGVEARLRAHDSVGEAVVELVDGATIAYVTPANPGHPVPIDSVRHELAAWLPAPAVPARLIEVPEFPVTAAGKVDRRRLLAEVGVNQTEEPIANGGGDLRSSLADIWQLVLRTRPAATDSFFNIGGDSLLAAEVVTRTVAMLGTDARHGSALIRSLLNKPTLDGFTAAVETLRHAGGAGADEPGVDFEAEALLGFPVPVRQGPPPRWDRPKHVLLTGATGFVGAFLLDRLLRDTEATVHCPVRARDRVHARRRVLANLLRFGLNPAGVESRIVCFPADLAASGLGLAADHLAELADRVDLVIHSAAQANFLYPYGALRPSNVDGTREIIRLAAARRVPVHFLSTIAVLAGFGTAGVRHVDEDLPLAHADRLTMGYAESKWVAERVLQEAAAQDVPVAVYRPYEITGDRRTGACNTETAICSLFKTITETGLAPDIPLPMDFVPVDYVADAIVHIATTHPTTARTYHLTNPRPASLADMLDRMRAAGYQIRDLPYAEWVDELVKHVSAHPTSPTAPFVSLCVDRGNKATISVKEMYFDGMFPTLGRANVERDLAGSGLACPPVDNALLDRYLDYFFASGYLQRPEGTDTLDTQARSLAEMYGYAFRRAHESGGRPGTTTLIYQFRDGSTHDEDVAYYFGGPEAWWATDVMACERITGRVLAIGCGAGRHAMEIARAGHEVIGLEPSMDAVTVGRARGLDTRLGSLLDPPDDLGTFDTFLLAGGGLHLLYLPGHREQALARLAELANDGAQIVGTCAVFVEGDPPAARGSEHDYRLRVVHGDERTPWSDWGRVVLLTPEDLDELVRPTPWTVGEVHLAVPPEVPSYLARLRLAA